MKIHPNKQAALAAIRQYQEGIWELVERTGVHESHSDESAEVCLTVRFYGDDGETVCRYSE
jgi:hypothetical protein